nr:hypothetical protein BaRGS_013393 [Batillaria attramentaria]
MDPIIMLRIAMQPHDSCWPESLQLETLCKELYETTDANIRTEAEKALVAFANSPDCLAKCQLLLERGSSPYAQLLAATTLTKLVCRANLTLPLEQRVEIRNYVLNYLATRPKLLQFVSQALVQLFARITKFGWFDVSKDEYIFRNVVTDVGKFIQSGSTQHVMIGVQLLSQLVCEMNQVSESEASRSLTKHRKIASSFRDTQLFEIFQLACSLLRSAAGNIKSLDFSDSSQHGLLSHTLRLAHNCLTFDFIGTSTDESSDDLCTVQIPTSWRSAFLDVNTLELFFDLYSGLPPSLSPTALSCLVQIASVRRSLFNNAERAKFLNHLVMGVRSILDNPQGLSDHNNYHEFCRLLARLKSNYQLGELVKVDNYPDVIKLIAEFTVTSLRMWQFAPNSVHYLLGLWQRMVASVPYVKATEPHLLETYTPEVTKAYITSRLESVHSVIREGSEDPLDDHGMISQQLEQLSTIGRCEYEKTCALLVQLFDESARRYQDMVSTGTQSVDLAIEEGRLTWLVYIIGAVIGGRVSFASTDEHDAMDGELVCRVLRLMNLTDSRLAQGGSEKLDLAILSFFEQFRKIYVGDQVQKTSKVYRRLSEVLGLSDESMVLSVFIGKIITNLKFWGRSEQIINKTLQLLSDLSVGYSSVRKLVKLEAVQFLLNSHTSEHFPFLGINANNSPISDMRCRTTFYTSLGRLLLVDLGEDEEKFYQFMMPLTGISVCFSMLKAALCGNYVNFGVFRLYGDDALDNVLGMFVKLLLSIPQSDLLDYPKLSQNYYGLLECLAQDHMSFIASLEPQVFLYILSTISEGLVALDTMVCTGCCATLDNIITYLFRCLTSKKKKTGPDGLMNNEAFLRILEHHPEILQQMLSTVLNIIMFEDCRNQWSMSRPLLGLILLNEEYFNKLRENIISSQPAEKQETMAQCFQNLMDGIERSLLTKNRDRFTQNLSVFRRDVNDSLKMPSGSPSSSSSSLDMMNYG